MPKIAKQTLKPKVQPTGGGILDSIVDVAELPDTGLKFLIFGTSGTGKTTLACDFPKPLLFVRPEQVEDGSRSVRTVKGIEVPRQLDSPDELDELVEVQESTERWKTIVLDGVTKFQDIVLKKVLGLKDIPAQLSWGIATQETWGIVGNELKEHLRKLLRLANGGCNVVILGGERGLNTEQNEAALLAPSVMIALTPSSMGWLHEVMDYNVHTFIRSQTTEKRMKVGDAETVKRIPTGKKEFCCHIAPHEIYQVKFRGPKGTVLPEVMVDPTYVKIAKLVNGNA